MIENNKNNSNSYILTDILRAAVVMLHSSFEEYFRNVLINWLPQKASDETLKKIPISLYAGNKSPEKLYLSDLAKYSHLNIDVVINESISKHMALKSFNNTSEILSWLSKIDIKLDSFDKLDLIDKCVNRRHKIVHEADMNKQNNAERLTSIKSGEIIPWIDAYVELVNLIEEFITRFESNPV